MNEDRLDEREFARRIAFRLSVGARDLDERVAERLHAARMTALSAQRPMQGVRPFARLRLTLQNTFAPALRPAALAVAILALVLVGDQWSMLSRVDSLQDVDMALLIDDLPIDAYLDAEFREWVQDDSRS